MNTFYRIIITSAILIFSFHLQAQDLNTVPINKGDQILISNFLGSIQVSSSERKGIHVKTDYTKSIPERAKGLKAIYPNGLEDNTNLGINIQKEGNVIRITSLGKESRKRYYKFTLPKGVNLKIDARNNFFSNQPIRVSNFEAEIEINALGPDVQVENVTGPLLINATNGDIDVVFDKVNQDNPIDINATNGNIDVSLPSDTPANITFKGYNGQLYTDFKLNQELKQIKSKTKKSKEALFFEGKKNSFFNRSNNSIKGKINGGGVSINLKATNKNVYLRKK
jgi:hypothetical protein